MQAARLRGLLRWLPYFHGFFRNSQQSDVTTALMSPAVLLQMLPRYNTSLSSNQWLDNVVWEEADGEEHPGEDLLLDMNDQGLTFEMLRGKGNIADYEGAAETVLPPAAKVRPGPQG